MLFIAAKAAARPPRLDFCAMAIASILVFFALVGGGQPASAQYTQLGDKGWATPQLIETQKA